MPMFVMHTSNVFAHGLKTFTAVHGSTGITVRIMGRTGFSDGYMYIQQSDFGVVVSCTQLLWAPPVLLHKQRPKPLSHESKG